MTRMATHPSLPIMTDLGLTTGYRDHVTSTVSISCIACVCPEGQAVHPRPCKDSDIEGQERRGE